MRNKLLLPAIVLLVFAGSFLAKWMLGRPDRGGTADSGQCERIVSLAPSITEILFALGAGENVVGVTRYCSYPPEAAGRSRVGGLFDPNLEKIVSLRPDLVVMLETNADTPAFEELGLHRLVVSHKNIEGILESFTTIGRALEEPAKAERMVAEIRARLERIERKTASRPRRRVMFSVYRNAGSGSLEEVTVVGGGEGFYNGVIRAAGGENACRNRAVPFPVVSPESILGMNPEVIIDLVRLQTGPKPGRQKILADWQQVADVEAVAGGRVYVLDDDFASIPGPRFILLVEKLARLFHPEADWQ